jgi:TolB-like protein
LRARLEPEECIQTVYKRGYRFSAEISTQCEEPENVFPRLVIPPFSTEFGVPENLGSTLAEETIARLSNARHHAISVLARDSVFALALRGLTAQQIGEILKADLALTGTLRALPTHFRLRAEMIRVEDGAQIWVEDLLVARSRIDGLESELVSRIALRMSFGVPEPAAAESSSMRWQTGVPGDGPSTLTWKRGAPGGTPPLKPVSAPTSSRRWSSTVLSLAAAAEKP